VEPSWIRECFFVLYSEFKNKSFTTEEAHNVLVKIGRSVSNVYKVLSPLMKVGLIKQVGTSKDGKTLYQIVVIEKGMGVKVPTKDEVLRLLRGAADIIRTAVPYECILLLLFYKVVSDKWETIASKYIAEGFEEEQAYMLANHEYITLYDMSVKQLLTWKEVARKYETPVEIENALLRMAELNIPDGGVGLEELKKLIDKVGLSTLAKKEDLRPILVDLVELFNKYDFSQVDYDIIGDAYQWILSYFAPTKAKEGETYTPREVIKLMIKLMDPENYSIIVDPACGSAAMLIESYKHVKSKLVNESPSLKLYGQDRNGDMVAVSKINLLLHGIKTDAKIFFADSLINPEFLKELGEQGADYTIANPPWNQDGYGEEKLNKPTIKEIYEYGYPPNNTADWAWIQLMLHTAKKKTVVVIDQGALFRGGKEREIRGKIIEEDLIEAVILLPDKLFYNTGAPGVIIVFNKNKPQERKGKILFINAVNEYKPHPEIRRLNILGEDNIERIVKAYREYSEIPGFSKIVSIEEVKKKNDYNLNVTLYVTPLEEEGRVDILTEYKELKRIEEEKTQLLEKIEQIMNELSKALGEGA
jgi:type I restriction enzyme M protein